MRFCFLNLMHFWYFSMHFLSFWPCKYEFYTCKSQQRSKLFCLKLQQFRKKRFVSHSLHATQLWSTMKACNSTSDFTTFCMHHNSGQQWIPLTQPMASPAADRHPQLPSTQHLAMTTQRCKSASTTTKPNKIIPYIYLRVYQAKLTPNSFLLRLTD